MSLLRAWITLLMLSFRRLLWSASTLMVLFPLGGCTLFLLGRDYSEAGFEAFSQEFVIVLFTAFVVPICALAYATTSIGGDREDRTLLFLLIRPIPRWLILSAKFLATLPLVMGLILISFWVYCRLAGEAGRIAFDAYLPAVVYMTLAYVAAFHLFAVTFRHSTIVALVYSLFMELLLGSMPGIIKRVAINFYGRSMIYDLGADHGLAPPDPQWFVPLSAPVAGTVLLGITGAAMVLSLVIFQRREYRDLT